MARAVMPADPAAVEMVEVVELHAAFVQAIEYDMEIERGELPDAAELGRRAALGGGDMLSQATARMAAQLRRQSRRKGFRGCIRRWYFAALLTLRMWSSWLACVMGWRVRHLGEVELRWDLPARPRELPPAIGDLIGRCHPRTGPPACAASIGAPVISP